MLEENSIGFPKLKSQEIAWLFLLSPIILCAAIGLFYLEMFYIVKAILCCNRSDYCSYIYRDYLDY